MQTSGWAEQIQQAREKLGLSRHELAARAGVTATTIWRLERGIIDAAHSRTRFKIIHALGYADEQAFFSVGPGNGKAASFTGQILSNVEGRLDELRRPEATPLPIYRWGACGDPRNVHSAPDPEDLEYPPIGKERLVGPRGFGVRVRGESMVNRNIHPGDIVWINPDQQPRIGRMVLARAWDLDEAETGIVVKVWRRNHDGGDLWGDGKGEEGTNPVICSRYEILGSVVWIQPHGFEPQ